MPNPDWGKRKTDEPIWEGPRPAEPGDFVFVDSGVEGNIQEILDAMEWPQLIIFKYGESDRVVAPFVVGVSSEGNPLMRGYQLEGVSKGDKGIGWRVFQIVKMGEVENHWDFFYPEDFDFDRFYPWTYKVFQML